ncbi:diphthamide synthesis protein [Candidatus Woesearchaeota archaeon]|nr:diphthamide synthesis protein [Candidatus Woesearchaeota archaeon]
MPLYNPELEKAIIEIRQSNAKLVCIQLPDGMKPMAKEIEETLRKETGARILIWLGSNFGACDIPLGLKEMGVDFLISWGHNRFHRREEGW